MSRIIVLILCSTRMILVMELILIFMIGSLVADHVGHLIYNQMM